MIEINSVVIRLVLIVGSFFNDKAKAYSVVSTNSYSPVVAVRTKQCRTALAAVVCYPSMGALYINIIAATLNDRKEPSGNSVVPEASYQFKAFIRH